MRGSAKKCGLLLALFLIPVGAVLRDDLVELARSFRNSQNATAALEALESADQISLVGDMHFLDGGSGVYYFEVLPATRQLRIQLPPPPDWNDEAR